MQQQEEEDLMEIEEISFDEQIFTMASHPQRNILASGLITGEIFVHQYDETSGKTQLLARYADYHKQSCRALAFSGGEDGGRTLFSASADKSIVKIDAQTGAVVGKKNDAHDAPINCLKMVSENIFATGDDDGVVKLWDTRKADCVMKWKENEDFITDMVVREQSPNQLIVTSGDGTLCVLHMKNGKLEAASDNQEDELLSMLVMKNGKKVVVGGQEGVLLIWSADYWGDISDRFPGHPNSIDSMLKVDESTILTGSSDGIIRIVNIQPNKMLGIVGEHSEYPIEKIIYTHDQKFVCSASHDLKIKFWDVTFLFDDDDDEDEDADKMDDGNSNKNKSHNNSNKNDDDNESWDDVEEEKIDEDEDEDDEEDDDDAKGKHKAKSTTTTTTINNTKQSPQSKDKKKKKQKGQGQGGFFSNLD